MHHSLPCNTQFKRRFVQQFSPAIASFELGIWVRNEATAALNVFLTGLKTFSDRIAAIYRLKAALIQH
ncbi:hypothetical protein [Phormidium sp. CCY1219]|uniref:hypothetical protein n=1 Tax=Phormidium sp. CCY1219 TaxID=2886104 RepID=UPI002D1EA7BB|nr:hypothetical protein [Phormidium sp. CCY1219]MEB3829444.1 hypothetical protein [Phormidium sp. CCY1219]